MDGIKKLESHTVESSSVIIVWLDPDDTTDEEAKSDLRDIVDKFKPDLPEGAEDPIISAIESKSEPLMEVHVLGELPELELRKIAKLVKEEIELVDGVSKIEDEGLRDIEIRVETSQRALSRYQLSLDDLVSAIRKQNVSVPGGTTRIAQRWKSTGRNDRSDKRPVRRS